MISPAAAKEMALSMPEAEEKDHFGRPSFRIQGKIFSTLWPVEKRIMVKLSAADQYVFTRIDPAVIFPVPGGWGRMGATFIDLKKVKKAILKAALETAWQTAAPKKLRLIHFGASE